MPNTTPLAERYRLPAALIAILAGLGYPLAFAPYNLPALLFVSIALLWLLVQRTTAKHALRLGFLFGLGQFGLGVSWVYVSMHVYGDTNVILSVLMTAVFVLVLALFPALTCWLSARLSRLGSGAISTALSPSLFIACWLFADWLRGWISSGFPWLYAGYATIDTPLAPLAAYGGVWLLSLLALTTAVSLALLISRRPLSALPLITLSAVGWVAALMLPQTPGVHATGEPQPVALVQANIAQTVKWEPEQQKKTRQVYAKLNASITNKDQLVIWSESAITEFYRDVQPWIEAQAAAFTDAGGALISGLPRVRIYPGYKVIFYNSVIVIGGGTGIYNKQKLVPFGEYVPFASIIRGLVPFFDLPMSSFTAGTAKQSNLQAVGDEIAPLVCYDIVFPWLVAHQAAGSNVLLEVSDDAWFGDSAAAWQHHQIARMRSIETGRYLLRDTNTGVTAIINAKGQVTAELPLMTRAILEGAYQPMEGATPFMGWGKWLAPLLALLLLLSGLIASQRSRFRTNSRAQSR